MSGSCRNRWRLPRLTNADPNSVDQGLKLRSRLIVAAVLLLALSSIVGVYSYYFSEKQSPVELRVFAAASLTHVVQDNESLTAFERMNDVKILLNLAGSDTLYQQIYSGSPADVYMAADSSWLAKLNQNGLLYNSQYWNFTSNVLVVIVPLDNPRNIGSLSDLAQPGVRIAVCAWTVPAGKYTNITLTKIDETWGKEASSHYKGPEWKNYRNRCISRTVKTEVRANTIRRECTSLLRHRRIERIISLRLGYEICQLLAF